jgi:hypothetical protein
MVFDGRLVGVVGAVPIGPVVPDPVVIALVTAVAEVIVAGVVVARLEDVVEVLAIVVLFTKRNGPVLVADEQKLSKGANSCSIAGCRVAGVEAPLAVAHWLHDSTSLLNAVSVHSCWERPTLCASL